MSRFYKLMQPEFYKQIDEAVWKESAAYKLATTKKSYIKDATMDAISKLRQSNAPVDKGIEAVREWCEQIHNDAAFASHKGEAQIDLECENGEHRATLRVKGLHPWAQNQWIYRGESEWEALAQLVDRNKVWIT